MMIIKSKQWSDAVHEMEGILKSQVMMFANEQGIPFIFIADSKDIQESIETIAHKFGDFADHVKKEKITVREIHEDEHDENR